MNLAEQIGSLGQQVTEQMQKGGVMLAQITNIKDPENLNRVLCKPISDDKDVAETDWCYCMTPMAGDKYGQFFFPNVDDLVVIAYIGSDIHHPIVLGRYWANDVASTYTIQDGKNEIGSIKTPAGTEVQFDDAEKKEKLTVTMPSGAEVKINDEAKTITINAPEKDNAISINWDSGEIEIKAKTKLTLSAGDTQLVLESSGAMSGESSNSIELTSGEVSVKGNSSVGIEGASVDVEATGTMTLKASGTNTVKGATVNIN